VEGAEKRWPAQGSCWILELYTVKGNPIVQEHGLYNGKMVRSKWGGQGPAFEHALEDIPVEFGDTAEFMVIDDTLMYHVQQAARVSGGRL